MLVQRNKVKFIIKQHNKFPSSLFRNKQILMEVEAGGQKLIYFCTNAGFKIHDGTSYFCPKKFSDLEAQKFLLHLPEEFLV